MSDAAMPALRIGGMSKRFGSTHALSGVDLEVLPGEVHGLLGHNGSGKSTLIKVLAGYQACDAGEVVLGGRRAPNPVPAGLLREERVGFVHQSLGLVERLTVAENLWLDEIARTSGGGVSFRSLCRDAAEALGDFGQDLDPRAAVAELTAVQKANLAIVRAMSRRGARKGEVPSLLVLDEPTAFLPEEDKRKLYDLVSVVASRGASVLFVSHFLDEVLRLCDRVTVLRDGKVVLGGRATAQMGRDELVAAIVGTSQETRGPVRRAPSDQCLVRIESLRSGTIRDLSLELCGGEVLGVTGLIGSGSDQVCSALFGAGPDTSGTLSVGAHRIDLRRLTPGRALRHGISHVPADRNRFGVFGALSVTDNVAVPRLRDYAGPLGLARRRMREDARRLADSYAVRPRDPGRRLHELSGGNAQKVLLAKGLHTGPRLLLLEEPTQGVDVGARRQIEQIVLDAAAAGTAVLLSSADPDQLADLCHRVVVMADGRVDRVLEGAEVTKHHITSAYLGTPAGPVSDRPPSLDRLDRVEVS